jgi:peptidoglycan hydrolase FlgJ
MSALSSTTAAGLPLPGSTAGLAVDVQSLSALKARAGSDPRGALREAAKQFESLFMNELLKSMRASLPENGLDNEGSRMATGLLDTQLSQKLTGLPGGLSDILSRQLERQMGLSPGPIPRRESANTTAVPVERMNRPVQIPQTGAAGFVQQHTRAAERAEAATGIPAAFMISQAALETGWGRKEIRHSDGSTAFNLFGIKAGANWRGPVAEVMTTEYVGGKPQKMVQRFRAYASYEESFADYARLMKDSPRYARVLAEGGGRQASATGFAQNLQRAGYATDPAYADKLTRVINTTLRLQRTVA